MSTSRKKVKTVNNAECVPKKQPIKTSINCLPDKCLVKIFQNLPWHNRIGIERVCKKWKEISIKSWSDIKALSFGYDFDGVDRMEFEHYSNVFRRGGNYITHLDFDDFVNNLTPEELFAAINENCKVLQHLEFNWSFKYRPVNLRSISPAIAQNLKNLQLNHMYDLKNVPYLLKTAVNVENVSFNTCYDYNVSSLRNLSSTCKELDLHSCKFNNKNHAKELFQKLSHLETLDVTNTKILPEALHPVSSTLLTLILGYGTENFFKGNNYKTLIMPNLKHLQLFQNSGVTDAVASSFHKCFPLLESLLLEGCENLKFDPSCCLGECKKLKVLNISETDVTDEGFTYLATHLVDLEAFKCDDCDLLTESGFITAIASLPKLNWFSVGYTSKFTEKFFKAALKSTELRTEDTPLEICVDYHSEKTEEVLKRCGLQTIEKSSPKPKNLLILAGGERLSVDVKE